LMIFTSPIDPKKLFKYSVSKPWNFHKVFVIMGWIANIKHYKINLVICKKRHLKYDRNYKQY
jgi:hypothetical protein